MPKPLGSLTTIKDCDGPGVKTDVCMGEEDLYVIMVYVIQLTKWSELANACPGVQNTAAPVPVPQLELHDERREG